MKTTKKILAMLFAVLMCITMMPLSGFVGISASALAETGQCGENVTYTFNSKTGELNITGAGKMYSYTGTSPFYSNEEIKTVKIGEGVTVIGSGAFRYCPALKTVYISDSVTEIESGAFSFCDALESISIGKGLKTVQDDFFYKLTALKTITISEENESFTVVDNVMFNKDKPCVLSCRRRKHRVYRTRHGKHD